QLDELTPALGARVSYAQLHREPSELLVGPPGVIRARGGPCGPFRQAHFLHRALSSGMTLSYLLTSIAGAGAAGAHCSPTSIDSNFKPVAPDRSQYSANCGVTSISVSNARFRLVALRTVSRA